MNRKLTLSALLLLPLHLFTPDAFAQCESDELVPAAALSGAGASQVALHGTTLILGAAEGFDARGNAYVFERGPDGWTEVGELVRSGAVPGDQFGVRVALSGDRALVGAPGVGPDEEIDTGAAYLFERSGTSWAEVARLESSDGLAARRFGLQVALAGGVAVATAESVMGDGGYTGAAYVFEQLGPFWLQLARLAPSGGTNEDRFGSSVAASATRIVVGAPGDGELGALAGAAWLFERTPTGWAERARLVSSDGQYFDRFGSSCAVGDDVVIVGARGARVDGVWAGAVYVFEQEGDAWVQRQKLTAPDISPVPGFAGQLALDGDTLVVAAGGDDALATDAGAVYVYRRGPEAWNFVTKLTAADASDYDLLGATVTVDGDTVVAGAFLADTHAPDTGSAHVFAMPGFARPHCFCAEAPPCGEADGLGGCGSSSGRGARLAACGSASVAADDLVLLASGLPRLDSAGLAIGTEVQATPFGDGELCVELAATGSVLAPVGAATVSGELITAPGLLAYLAELGAPVGAGATLHAQLVYRDPEGACGSGFNSTNALAIALAP